IRPLLKKPALDPSELSNYRPVSNLPWLGKVIERVVASQLQAVLEETDYLDPFQTGFRADYGVETALVGLMDDLQLAMDRGSVTLLVLLDLSAAFDTIDHSILLERLRGLGVGGTVFQWFSSYLSDRFQMVLIGDCCSSKSELRYGVPQGSILSPMLFNIYMKPLGEIIRGFGAGCYQYADDTQIYFRSAFYQLRLIRQLSPFLEISDLKTVVNLLVTSRLDFCNALYVGLPLYVVRKLQLVQNAAARLVSGSSRRDHITPLLMELHWLPIGFRAKYKVLVITYKALNGLGPRYLRERLLRYEPHRPLRSLEEVRLQLPPTRLMATQRRAFSAAAPRLWNALPAEIRSSPSLSIFRKHLKTHLFSQDAAVAAVEIPGT
ncbi:uncharacterized protein LOC128339283, partial [Hemicordylus capensis]|uniref:uncharacterized protein LOC128339283 n=1 Tax=Hemicordylus capensis TaxID=884348 RepID=UPI002304A589